MDIPILAMNDVPYVTTEQMIEVDRAMMEDYQTVPVLSLDAPSGVDTTSGTVFDPAIRATATMTLALPKEGLRTPSVAANVGELYLADISVPPALYTEPALQLKVGSIFAESDISRLNYKEEYS